MITNAALFILLVVTNVWHPIVVRQSVCTIANCKEIHHAIRYEGLIPETNKIAVIIENGIEYRKVLTNWPANVHDYIATREVKLPPDKAPLPTRRRVEIATPPQMPPMPPQ